MAVGAARSGRPAGLDGGPDVESSEESMSSSSGVMDLVSSRKAICYMSIALLASYFKGNLDDLKWRELCTAWRMRICILALLMVNSHSSDVGLGTLPVPESGLLAAMTIISRRLCVHVAMMFLSQCQRSVFGVPWKERKMRLQKGFRAANVAAFVENAQVCNAASRML